MFPSGCQLFNTFYVINTHKEQHILKMHFIYCNKIQGSQREVSRKKCVLIFRALLETSKSSVLHAPLYFGT